MFKGKPFRERLLGGGGGRFYQKPRKLQRAGPLKAITVYVTTSAHKELQDLSGGEKFLNRYISVMIHNLLKSDNEIKAMLTKSIIPDVDHIPYSEEEHSLEARAILDYLKLLDCKPINPIYLYLACDDMKITQEQLSLGLRKLLIEDFITLEKTKSNFKAQSEDVKIVVSPQILAIYQREIDRKMMEQDDDT